MIKSGNNELESQPSVHIVHFNVYIIHFVRVSQDLYWCLVELMTKTLLSENIEALMLKEGGLNISKLAKSLNIPRVTLQHIISGKTKKPRKELIHLLSNYFSVPPDDLMNQKLTNREMVFTNAKSLPIFERDALHRWPQISNIGNTTYTAVQGDYSDSSFGMYMHDSSMYPIFPEDCLVIFDPELAPKDKDFVLVKLDSNNTVVFKKLIIENDNRFIKSINQELDELGLSQLNPNDVIIAKATTCIKRFS